MRPTKAVLLLMCFFGAKFARSQSNELMVRGETGRLYLEHTVVPKENWYSIGRLYNVSPKELAPFNKLTLAQPLIIGQNLEIPLTAANFSQNGGKAPVGETLIPVIHITQEKEWMYRISVNHNRVPIPSLEKWNNITKDQVHPGMHLIVGYLKVKTALSALASNKPDAVAARAGADHPVMPMTGADSPKAVMPASYTSTSTPPKVTPAVAQPTPAAPTPPASRPPAVTSPTPPPASTPQTPHFNGGTFRTDFTDGGKLTSGQAGIFKSTSGWQDGRYYALMNNVAVGTIVKIADPVTGKMVYAKVLGQLPDMKESNGLAIRISNAAAAELGEGDGRFSVQISY